MHWVNSTTRLKGVFCCSKIFVDDFDVNGATNFIQLASLTLPVSNPCLVVWWLKAAT